MADVTIGLETHVQLDTATKLFCACRNEAGAEPNTRTCPTCLGLPGAKPRTNAAAVEAALQAGLALDCDIADEAVFARKTYFYPDMSKNFQITQYEQPLASGGTVTVDGRDVGIRRVHIEEDPARLEHRGDAETALVDYTRAGTPLIEVVTEPDFTAPKQARQFLQTLTRIMEYLGVYDPEAGSVRTDANVSVDGGNRVEVKNITGTRAVADALQYEVERQQQMQDRGESVARETRQWLADQERTRSARSKETEADYGYIRDPDLVSVAVPDEQVAAARESLPELPDAKRTRFRDEYGVGAELADALVTDPEMADAFEAAADAVGADLAASWFSGPIKKTLNYHDMSYSASPLRAEWLVMVLEKLRDGDIADQAAETVIQELMEAPRAPEEIIAEEGLEKAGGDALAAWVEEAVADNPDAVADYEQGDDEAINFLVGQVMQKSGGSADPKEAREALQERLD